VRIDTTDPLPEIFTGLSPWRRRGFAIVLAIFYAFMPWWVYEKECHYKGWSYGKHCVMNLLYMLKWIFFLETPADIEFEKTINDN
jgi:hypothetical protein